MRAAVLRGGSVEAPVIGDPAPGAGQLLVRSLACGICASDLHFMDHPEAGAGDDSGMSTYDQDVDIVTGHEYCAEVVGYGLGTERRIPAGTRVTSLPVLPAAGGRKIIGQNPESPGGFGEYLLLTEAITRVVASDLPSEIVCIADAISVGWSAAPRAQLTTKEVSLVIGCGRDRLVGDRDTQVPRCGPGNGGGLRGVAVRDRASHGGRRSHLSRRDLAVSDHS
jgi:threonine dehydrogenase-like Zn-dependent dehydrogenase